MYRGLYPAIGTSYAVILVKVVRATIGILIHLPMANKSVLKSILHPDNLLISITISSNFYSLTAHGPNSEACIELQRN